MAPASSLRLPWLNLRGIRVTNPSSCLSIGSKALFSIHRPLRDGDKQDVAADGALQFDLPTASARSKPLPAPIVSLRNNDGLATIAPISEYLPSSDITVPQAAVTETPARRPLTTRMPRAVQAVYLTPLRREPTYGVPSCDLQLRSFSVRNLEFFADFALRAAYYLKLPAFGPTPLPRIVERWTVPKSNFIFKKSQENFERKTLRRLIQIKDGHPDTVELWLAFLKKHAYYGVGMKANIWDYSELGHIGIPNAAAYAISKTYQNKIVNDSTALMSKRSSRTTEALKEVMKDKKFMAAVGVDEQLRPNASRQA